jgi:hypothetical protein
LSFGPAWNPIPASRRAAAAINNGPGANQSRPTVVKQIPAATRIAAASAIWARAEMVGLRCANTSAAIAIRLRAIVMIPSCTG